MESWRSRAACLGISPSVFFPSDETEAGMAKAVCMSCDSQLACLDWSVRVWQDEGIWGGLIADRRRRLRSIFVAGDPMKYHRALAAEIDAFGRLMCGFVDDRPEDVERTCDRCGGRVGPGRHPVDRNGPGATCGRASTYNRGCRCDPCKVAKSDVDRARRRVQCVGAYSFSARRTATIVPSIKTSEDPEMSTTETSVTKLPESVDVDPEDWEDPSRDVNDDVEPQAVQGKATEVPLDTPIAADDSEVEAPEVESPIPLSDLFHDTGLKLNPKQKLPFETWERLGENITRAHRSSDWWFADWLNLGEGWYGEAHAQGINPEGLDPNTISNRKWVGNAIPDKYRRSDLSFTHHRIVAGVESLPKLKKLLQQAVDENLSTRDLQKLVNGLKPKKEKEAKDREKSTTTFTLSVTVDAADEKHLGIVMQAAEDMIRAQLEERNVEPTKVTASNS